MKGLRGRIVLVGLLSAIIGLLISRFLVRTVAESVAARFAGGAVTLMMARDEGVKCAADPRAWSFVVPGVTETYAYDPETLAPLNPLAPPLDRALLASLRDGDERHVAVRLGDPVQSGALIAKIAGGGPCSLVQTHWSPVGRTAPAAWLFLLMAVSVGSATALISFAVAIRPLARRLATLRRAATLVGAEVGYAHDEKGTEDDLGQLGRELDRAHVRIRADAERLRADHTALERHLADVAHDLRTPIASLQLALEQALTINQDPALHEPLGRALEDTVYAGALAENLRLASKLTGTWDASDVASVDLRNLVERVALRLKFFASQQKIDLEVALPDGPLFVSCQAVAVEQAVANVVENAVTLGEAGGHVAIVLQALPEARFVLTVVDDGPGVRLSELPRLGERTFRSDAARQRAPRGSGLGLAITAAVCERSGWELAFATEEPQGLRVTIRGRATSVPTSRALA
jgi:signal transduction histidine kinase